MRLIVLTQASHPKGSQSPTEGLDPVEVRDGLARAWCRRFGFRLPDDLSNDMARAVLLSCGVTGAMIQQAIQAAAG